MELQRLLRYTVAHTQHISTDHRHHHRHLQGIATGMTTGLASGIASSLPSGIETPDVVNLRKGTETGGEARPLYQVLEQKAVPVGQGGLLGTDHVYVMPTGQQEAGRGKDKRKPDFLKGLQQVRDRGGAGGCGADGAMVSAGACVPSVLPLYSSAVSCVVDGSPHNC